MRVRRRRGQSVTEYAIVFSVVAAAVIGMQIYLKRGLQAKEKGTVDLLTQVSSAPLNAAGDTRTLGKTAQYEPYYANSDVTTAQSSDFYEERLDKGEIIRSGITSQTTRQKLGVSAQRGHGSLNSDFSWINSAP